MAPTGMMPSLRPAPAVRFDGASVISHTCPFDPHLHRGVRSGEAHRHFKRYRSVPIPAPNCRPSRDARRRERNGGASAMARMTRGRRFNCFCMRCPPFCSSGAIIFPSVTGDIYEKTAHRRRVGLLIRLRRVARSAGAARGGDRQRRHRRGRHRAERSGSGRLGDRRDARSAGALHQERRHRRPGPLRGARPAEGQLHGVGARLRPGRQRQDDRPRPGARSTSRRRRRQRPPQPPSTTPPSTGTRC